ncbi:substrate-binding domain-containing protein [Agromyces sp. CFH 90414]|uniref:Substrate-binding domain-containing protein n=1 Tax=Agromyces agglutinans TaxID=2662258 RepID=A0A6I2F8K8_9MICO|nr:LacI family DNA-binding transcriptional regulator [Agromyces agglutinans]MRG61182.1 substrate-binding domain-containing protein [Agromyces agglutinans]
MGAVSIREVAALAGVSITTVSNVLNRPEIVSRKAVERVEAAIESLGYVPNIAARQLRAGRSSVIGMAVINITNPFFAEMALGAERAAEASGYAVFVGNSYDSAARESHYLDLFDRQRLDGVLLAPIGDDLSALERFAKRSVPVVLVDRVDPSGRHASVSVDDVLGGRLAASHLIEGGARRLMFVGGPTRIAQMRERLEGTRIEAERARLDLAVVDEGALSVRLGLKIGRDLAAMPRASRPDGIVGGNDEVALGIMHSLIQAGVDVPGEVSIVGYDDIDFASASTVALTSIRQPSHEIGLRAAQLLLAALAGEDLRDRSVRFDPELVVRQSSRPVG